MKVAVSSSPDPNSAPPPPPGRRSTRSTSSSSSSSIISTPSPSHFLIQTPFHSSSSSIPFSWEQTPGIPKFLPKTLKSHPNPHLPLPPPLRSESFTRKKRPNKKIAAGDVDPFAVALIECAKDPPQESDLWIGNRSSEIKGGRRFSVGFGFGFGLSDLYGSCKTSCSVAESTIEIPRYGRWVGAYRILNRRFG